MAKSEIERKFLVKGYRPFAQWPVVQKVSVIEQTYLKSPTKGVSKRVRRRFFVEERRSKYTHTIKTRVGEGHNMEEEREIGPVDFIRLEKNADPDRFTVRKLRHVFDWEGWTWELDVFQLPPGIVLMEVEVPHLDVPVKMPPFIDIDREVTDEKGWSNSSLSKRERWV